MSGGNAQKVVLARQLVNRPELLVLVEPTQGVDVGAKEEIHRIIDGLADEGTAVLVVTSDLGEVQRIVRPHPRRPRRRDRQRIPTGCHAGPDPARPRPATLHQEDSR